MQCARNGCTRLMDSVSHFKPKHGFLWPLCTGGISFILIRQWLSRFVVFLVSVQSSHLGHRRWPGANNKGYWREYCTDPALRIWQRINIAIKETIGALFCPPFLVPPFPRSVVDLIKETKRVFHGIPHTVSGSALYYQSIASLKKGANSKRLKFSALPSRLGWYCYQMRISVWVFCRYLSIRRPCMSSLTMCLRLLWYGMVASIIISRSSDKFKHLLSRSMCTLNKGTSRLIVSISIQSVDRLCFGDGRCPTLGGRMHRSCGYCSTIVPYGG